MLVVDVHPAEIIASDFAYTEVAFKSREHSSSNWKYSKDTASTSEI